MKKRGMIIIVIVLVVIIIAIAVFFLIPKGLSREDVLKNPSDAMEFCNKSPNDKQSNCYMMIADVLGIDNPDVALQACLAINGETNGGDRKNCVEGLAMKQTNQTKAVEICSAFKDDARTREHCFGGIIANSANISIDTQLAMCDSKIGMDKDNCYRGLAENLMSTNPKKSVEICSKMSDKTSKDNCLNNIIGNPEIVKANVDLSVSICDALALKDRCYNYIAGVISGTDIKQAAKICQKLSDEVQVYSCYNGIWFASNTVVISNYDFTISLCNFLTLKKDECLRKMAGEFMNSDRTKAAAICNLMSASGASGCLADVNRGQ